MGVLDLYAIAVGTTLALVSVLWLASVLLRDASIIDMFWGVLFVAIAWALLVACRDAVAPKMLLVTLMVTIWGLRLAFHLAMRNLGQGEDSRYVLWRLNGGANWWLKTYYRIYLLQGAMAVIVAAPIVAAFYRPRDFFIVNAVGFVLWLAGFLLEFAADLQLTRFRARADTRTQVMNEGLWRLSRHPNYFGDALQWWGLGLVAFTGATWWAVVGPLAMTLFFIYLSNDVLEKGLAKRRPGYASYVANTSAFFLWPSPPTPDDAAESRTIQPGAVTKNPRSSDSDGNNDTT
jgi:steroid 5-alpha reductase family enzyme